MIALKPFKVEDWEYLNKWTTNEKEIIQFAGGYFTFPIDKKQVEKYLSDSTRTVFKVNMEDSSNSQTIGIAEICHMSDDVAKIARVLIGDESMRGRGIGTTLIHKLSEHGFHVLKKKRIILNVYTWNKGAIKCYEKVGFKKTDKPILIVQVEGEDWETIEMEKLR